MFMFPMASPNRGLRIKHTNWKKDAKLPQGSPFSHLSPKSVPEIFPDILAGGGLATIQKWLTTCHDVHQGCASITSTAKLPTRLLDVGLRCKYSSLNLHMPQ